MVEQLNKKQLEEIGIVKDDKLTSFGCIFLIMVITKSLNLALKELYKEYKK